MKFLLLFPAVAGVEEFLFFPPTYIIADSCTAVPNALLYHFGVLTSQMHVAWMRQVCGRIKSDYHYSNGLVYNNFPFPQNTTDRQREMVERAAKAVLDARTHFPEATLADLYDPNAMPQELLKAHRDLDSAVDACLASGKFKTDLERLEFLFNLYRQHNDPLGNLGEHEARRTKRMKVQKEKKRQEKSVGALFLTKYSRIHSKQLY